MGFNKKTLNNDSIVLQRRNYQFNKGKIYSKCSDSRTQRMCELFRLLLVYHVAAIVGFLIETRASDVVGLRN